MKTKQVKRDWSQALEKVQEEGMCRYYGLSQDLQAAHVIGREHDHIEIGPRGGETRVVQEEDIVVLCSFHHHGVYDARQLDLLAFLYPYEQARAVLVAGGITKALRRITGSRDA
ncbi:MAG: hypothetical protein CYG60_02560 [Actinobacteria bacterium]|nr:MAG: hypothetical protein CYG60_02560 [Actinomycetota bacterium]